MVIYMYSNVMLNVYSYQICENGFNRYRKEVHDRRSLISFSCGNFCDVRGNFISVVTNLF